MAIWDFFTRRRSQAPPVDLQLLGRCARIVRGVEPGGRSRLDGGGSFPEWGEADLEGRSLVWSGPFDFDLDVKYGLAQEILPNVYVVDYPHTLDHPSMAEFPKPLLCFVVAESKTWATLWPAK